MNKIITTILIIFSSSIGFSKHLEHKNNKSATVVYFSNTSGKDIYVMSLNQPRDTSNDRNFQCLSPIPNNHDTTAESPDNFKVAKNPINPNETLHYFVVPKGKTYMYKFNKKCDVAADGKDESFGIFYNNPIKNPQPSKAVTFFSTHIDRLTKQLDYTTQPWGNKVKALWGNVVAGTNQTSPFYISVMPNQA